jgi:DNA repair exonuclease SbcCD ATPase subunit
MEVDKVYRGRVSELQRKLNENNLLQKQVDGLVKRIESIIDSLDVGKDALSFLEKLANSRRGAMKSRIESVLTRALRLVYGDSYRVEMEYTVKRNRSDMTIKVVREIDGQEIRRNPSDGQGGGVSDTIAVPLRFMIILGSGQTENIAILDECYKHMDERVGLVAEFLKLLADELNMQIVLCSHHEEMEEFSDKTYYISEEPKGASKIRTRED